MWPRTGGQNEKLGACPAAMDTNLDGSHDGEDAGRACWVVARTLCEGEVQGTFAKKYVGCEQCDFYQMVVEQEGFNYKHVFFLLQKEKKSNQIDRLRAKSICLGRRIATAGSGRAACSMCPRSAFNAFPSFV